MNGRGVTLAAARRHMRQHWPEAQNTEVTETFPSAAAHVWDWFLELIPLEGSRWRAGDVDLGRAAKSLLLMGAMRPSAFEMRLLAEVIGQLGRLERDLQGDENGYGFRNARP